MLKSRKIISALFFSSLFLSVVSLSCDKDDDDDDDNEDRYTLSGAANGANERPNPVTTNGTGNITGTYHLEHNMLEYTITWSNLSVAPTMMHFHGPADVNTAAGVQAPITFASGAGTSGTTSGMITLTAEQETDLLAGKWYYNIHTSNFSPGEIRGQVTAAP